jgi:hypothetical protein
MPLTGGGPMRDARFLKRIGQQRAAPFQGIGATVSQLNN